MEKKDRIVACGSFQVVNDQNPALYSNLFLSTIIAEVQTNAILLRYTDLLLM